MTAFAKKLTVPLSTASLHCFCKKLLFKVNIQNDKLTGTAVTSYHGLIFDVVEKLTTLLLRAKISASWEIFR